MYVRSNPYTVGFNPANLYSCGLGDAASAALIGGGISAGVALATNAAALWMNSIQLSHEADTATTQVVNGLEPLLNANKNAYLAGPGTCQDQALALAAYDSAIMWLRSPKGCGAGSFGSAGNRCISDRIGPACASGQDSGCAKFPWDVWYRAPIADDPRAAGCAAALAASNPDASLQAAISNIYSLVQGSSMQSNPGLYASGSGAPANTGAPAGSSGSLVTAAAPFSLSTLFLGLPLWVWLAAAGLLVVMV